MKAKKSKANLESQKLGTEELLKRIANSPCASRIVPPSQSLEDYLRESSTREISTIEPKPTKESIVQSNQADV